MYHLKIVQFAVREAAKEVGLWDKAPYLENIPPKIMEDFYKTVSYTN